MSLVVAPPDTSGDALGAGTKALDETAEVAPIDQLLDSISRDGVSALRKLWQQIGVSSSMFSGLEDDASVQISRFSVDLDADDADETLLRFTDSGESDFQYLLISRSGDSWIGHGSVELWNQKQNTPEHRIESVEGGSRWLVIRSLKGSGAGFERFNDTWHRLSGSSLSSVLTYPVKGHVSGHGMPFDRSFTGSHVALRTSVDTSRGASGGGSPTVEIELTARYTNGDLYDIDGLEELFTRTATVRYTFDDDEKRFVLDESASQMTEVEIVGLFSDDEEGFLKHNFQQLRDIAQSGSDSKREWLEQFLKGRSDSSEKSILEDLLAPVETAGGAEIPGAPAAHW